MHVAECMHLPDLDASTATRSSAAPSRVENDQRGVEATWVVGQTSSESSNSGHPHIDAMPLGRMSIRHRRPRGRDHRPKPGLNQRPDAFTRTQVHVATGMVAEQLEISADLGVDRLRAHSYANGRTLSPVAADIIARRFTLPS